VSVFVLDRSGKQALIPRREKRAWLLFAPGRARIHRLTPFAVRLVDRTEKSGAILAAQAAPIVT